MNKSLLILAGDSRQLYMPEYLISKGFEYDVVSGIVEEYKKRIDIEAESFYSRQDEYEKAKERYKVAREKLKNARKRF